MAGAFPGTIGEMEKVEVAEGLLRILVVLNLSQASWAMLLVRWRSWQRLVMLARTCTHPVFCHLELLAMVRCRLLVRMQISCALASQMATPLPTASSVILKTVENDAHSLITPWLIAGGHHRARRRALAYL